MFRSYFFPEQQSIDIHEPLDKRNEKAFLKKIRLVSWVILLMIHGWQLIVCGSIFIQIKFLTMIGYFTTLLYYALVSIDALLESPSRWIHFSHNYKYVVEALFEISITLQVPITLVYWLLLHPYVLSHFPLMHVIRFDFQHSLPFIFLLVDFKFNCFRFNKRRLIYAVSVSCIYLLFNMIYSLNHHPIYPIMTWRDKASYINLAVSIIVGMGSFMLFRRLKSGMMKKIGNEVQIKRE